ncbi:MAG: hypothetical protein Q8P22_00030 [Chloroflexota bacterium]|nr:hypothetical protein [Chloroflexota bacterium]
MDEYKVAVTTRLVGGNVSERMVTVRADTVEEAEETYRQLLESLSTWGPTEDGASDNGDNPGQRCPQHGKARQGKGGKLYCPTKLADGSWCKWRAKS